MPPCFKTESAYPDWSRQPKRVDASISQRSDDGGEEVLDALEAIPVKSGTERPAKPVRITEVVMYALPQLIV